MSGCPNACLAKIIEMSNKLDLNRSLLEAVKEAAEEVLPEVKDKTSTLGKKAQLLEECERASLQLDRGSTDLYGVSGAC